MASETSETTSTELSDLLESTHYVGAPVNNDGSPIWLTPETSQDDDD
jgi:hypothetical protein